MIISRTVSCRHHYPIRAMNENSLAAGSIEFRPCKPPPTWKCSSITLVGGICNCGRAVAISAPLRMIYRIINNAKIHKAARTEIRHLVRPTLGPPPNIRQLGTSPATLQLATSAGRWQCAIRLANCMIAFSVAAGLSIRQQWAEETSATLVEKIAHPATIHEATYQHWYL
jgi:hypothetical protein